MDVMASLVKNIIRTGFNDLTPESIVAAEKAIVDTIGTMMAGSSIEGCRLLVNAVKGMGGTGESTIAVFGGKVSPNMAALANGAMARAMDIDDVNDAFPLHPGAVIVPTALAVAEGRGGTDGRDLITSVALGQDLMVRMAYATKLNPIISGRYNLFKVFAAVGTAGKLMGLDEEALSNAMGVAYSRLVGDAQALHEGVMTAYIQEGEAAESAIESAILAERGITGTRGVLQGERGFFNVYEPDPNLNALTSEVGSIFRGVDIGIKPYSSCRSTHEAIDLVLGVRKYPGIVPDRIERIIVRVNNITFNLTGHPLDLKHHPKNKSDAQFSLPFTIAAAFIRGDFFIDEITDEAINNEEILRLAARVTPILDNECQTDLSLGSTVLEIETNDGEKFSVQKSFPRGNPKDPMSLEDCMEKFRKCAKYAFRPFSEKQIDRITSILIELENLERIEQLVRLLVPEEGKSGRSL